MLNSDCCGNGLKIAHGSLEIQMLIWLATISIYDRASVGQKIQEQRIISNITILKQFNIQKNGIEI